MSVDKNHFDEPMVAPERNRVVEDMLRIEANRQAWGLSSQAPTAAAPLTHCPCCKQRLRKPRAEFHGLKIVDGKRKD